MKSVQVISYSGYKADESPRIHKLGDTLLPMEARRTVVSAELQHEIFLLTVTK
ncbi:MAG TPA: hypothetical protein VGP66_10870 [Candidatus Acidoferrum sp.]|jgi:hypothetical protein|nr:hypothetical protein [Candidatus Acidoferrum sp.]